MHLNHGIHLAYCTNVHPGEDWAQTLSSLERWTLPVKQQVSPAGPFAIGLRLSDRASRELSEPCTLLAFQRWLGRHNCYIFTINGFPFGEFHGQRVKERVYLPDWTSPERLAYTNRLFELLVQLGPPQVEGSVSTLPCSFKDFIQSPEQERLIRANLWRCVEHIAKLAARTGRRLHLGLEPEPFGLLENSHETVHFFDRMREEHPCDERLPAHLGVNYDTCHFALAFEEPNEAIGRLQQHGIQLSKIHLSNALKLRPSTGGVDQLAGFADEVYLHQVAIRGEDGSVVRFKDLDLALASSQSQTVSFGSEWRVHFHVPLHSLPPKPLNTTEDHLLGVLELLAHQPGLCSHLEMETYTWAVLPESLRTREVSEQIAEEYAWTLQRLMERGINLNSEVRNPEQIQGLANP